jgi:hypothetical protein
MVRLDTLYLTFDCTQMGADQMAAPDAYRACTAVGQPEEACLAEAIAPYREQHPGIPAEAAIAAVTRLFRELDLLQRCRVGAPLRDLAAERAAGALDGAAPRAGRQR